MEIFQRNRNVEIIELYFNEELYLLPLAGVTGVKIILVVRDSGWRCPSVVCNNFVRELKIIYSKICAQCIASI